MKSSPEKKTNKMEKVTEKIPNTSKETFKTKRLEEIFSKLPDTNLNDCKTLYTKDLDSKSEYLKNRAQKFLGLIQEAENLLSQSQIVETEETNQPVGTETENKEEQTTKKEVINTEKEEVPATKKEEISKEIEKETVEIEKKKETVLEPQIVIEQKQEKNLVENLSKEEVKIAQEEMVASTPMEFEPQKTKTDLGLFLRNQIVKLASGFKVSEKMKDISKKLRKGALLGTGIFVLWPTTLGGKDGKTSYIYPDNVDGKITSISHEKVTKVASEESKRTIDTSFYYKLSPSAQEIYLYSFKSITDSTYLILDKPTETMYVIDKDKKLIGSFPVLVGKTKGEMPNKSNAESDIAGPSATTPAGKYRIGNDSIEASDYSEFNGKIFSIYGSNNLAIHITYPAEYKIRTAALNSPTPEDNRKSWGCVNVSEKMFDKYLKGNILEKTTLYITPDDTSMSLNPKTGKIEDKALAQLKPEKTLKNNI